MAETRDVIVIGGGCLGLAAAWRLACSGHRVRVLEAGQWGQGSTALAAGIVSVQAWRDDEVRLIQQTRADVQDLVDWGREHDWPEANAAWHPRGALTVARGDQAHLLRPVHRGLRALNEPAQWLTGREISQAHPFVSVDGDDVALWTRGDGWVEAGDLVQLLRRRAAFEGAVMSADSGMAKPIVDEGVVRGAVTGNGQEWSADTVVVAAGSWTRRTWQHCGVALPLLSYRAQLAALEGPVPSPMPAMHDLANGFYSRPESGTRLLAGDGTDLNAYEPDAWARTPDAPFIEGIARGVLARFRDGHAFAYRAGWSGLCVGTPDQRALVGAVAGVDGGHVLSGDNGFGLMRSTGLARVLARAVDRRPLPPDRAYEPSRFGPDPPAAFELKEGYSLPTKVD